jgi:hypothetical protein
MIKLVTYEQGNFEYDRYSILIFIYHRLNIAQILRKSLIKLKKFRKATVY